jgi:hypothetical protein
VLDCFSGNEAGGRAGFVVSRSLWPGRSASEWPWSGHVSVLENSFDAAELRACVATAML